MIIRTNVVAVFGQFAPMTTINRTNWPCSLLGAHQYSRDHDVRDEYRSGGCRAQKKVAALEESLPRYLVLSSLAGAYVGLGFALIFAIGAPLAAANSPFTKVVVGASFGVALSLVLVAGAELFTRNTMLLPLGRFASRASWSQLAGVWGWSLFGNLVR